MEEARAAAGWPSTCRRRSGPRKPKISPSRTLMSRSASAAPTLGRQRRPGAVRATGVAVVLGQARASRSRSSLDRLRVSDSAQEVRPMPKTVPQLPGIDSGDLSVLPGRRGRRASCSSPARSATRRAATAPSPAASRPRRAPMLDNVGRLLHAAGLDFRDVVKCTVYLARLQRVRRDERRSTASTSRSEPPTRATVGVTALAADYRVEIEVIAARSITGAVFDGREEGRDAVQDVAADGLQGVPEARVRDEFRVGQSRHVGPQEIDLRERIRLAGQEQDRDTGSTASGRSWRRSARARRAGGAGS